MQLVGGWQLSKLGPVQTEDAVHISSRILNVVRKVVQTCPSYTVNSKSKHHKQPSGVVLNAWMLIGQGGETKDVVWEQETVTLELNQHRGRQ